MPVPRERPPLPSDIEDHRDERWGRDITRCVQSPIQAEHFIERNGFVSCMTDSRRPGPSLYIAVCGRRDAVMPRNVQIDEEASLTWTLKDELLRRGEIGRGGASPAAHRGGRPVALVQRRPHRHDE